MPLANPDGYEFAHTSVNIINILLFLRIIKSK